MGVAESLHFLESSSLTSTVPCFGAFSPATPAPSQARFSVSHFPFLHFPFHLLLPFLLLHLPSVISAPFTRPPSSLNRQSSYRGFIHREHPTRRCNNGIVPDASWFTRCHGRASASEQFDRSGVCCPQTNQSRFSAACNHASRTHLASTSASQSPLHI